MPEFKSFDHCSFCSKLNNEIEKLFESDDASICNNCLALIDEIIQSNKLRRPESSNEHACSFCQKKQKDGIAFISGPNVRICNECSINFLQELTH